MPDLIQTVMAIMANVQPELGWIVYNIYARSDFPHPIRFCSSKEGMAHTVQNQPGSNLVGLVRFWPKAPCLEASRCARIIEPGSGRTQPACYQFPTFRLSCIQMAWIILSKTSLDLIWFWLTVSGFQFLAKQIWSGSKPVCRYHWACFWPTLPS